VRNEVAVVCIHVLVEGSRGHPALDVQIETVDSSITEGSGLSICNPLVGLGTESSPEELGEVLSNLCRLKVVVGRPTTTNAEKNLLAIRLTLLDTRLNARAVG
jgi:hypothetical protein